MEDVAPGWYALKVFYNKVFEMEDKLASMGLACYLAVEKRCLKGAEHLAAARYLASLPEGARADSRYIKEGPVIYLRHPMISSLIFVRATPEQIRQVDALLQEKYLNGRGRGFIYKTADKQSFAVIPDPQMASFRLVTESGVSGLRFFANDDITCYKQGDKVRVKEGPLKGAEGYIRRIQKDRRLLVSIEGVVAVATSYIPMHQLEKIES
jgi:transcription antitermination factor NusG